MMMSKEEIDILRRQKDSIQMTIYSCIQSKQDASGLVKEYHRVVNKLIEGGAKVYIRAPYLKLEYWGLTPNDVYVEKNIVTSTISTPSESMFVVRFVYNNYTEDFIKENVENYFKLIGLEGDEDVDFEEVGSKIIYIKNYIYKGTNEGFNIIKKSTSAILGLLNKSNDPDLEIFGKIMK